jgi:C-terminal processing protease CtpA/Prc
MRPFYAYMLVVLATMHACTDDEQQQLCDTSNDNCYVNSWIYTNMKANYLWEQHIPTNVDMTLPPNEYFAALLYKDEDRFSWIQDNYADLLNSLSGVQMEAGYEYSLYLKVQGSHDVIGVVRYVKPNSPATQSGLKRGDIFIEVNGMRMTTDNYRSVVGNMNERHTLGMADANDFDNVTYMVELSVMEYKENPILMDSIYTIEGRRIGYVVYNFFANDNGDGSLAYAKELNDVMGKFKELNIQDIIIDMRYNGGGAVSTAIALASMISTQGSGDIFSIGMYNNALNGYYQRKYGANYDKDYFVDYIANNTIMVNKLGMERLYVIALGGTASASELIINCLRPYINVIIVGDTTYGKNVGSWSLYRANDTRNRWGMQPIIVKFANKNHHSDYGMGFAPDVIVRDNSDGHPFKQLGDTQEVMLKTAIEHIFGNVVSAQASMLNVSSRAGIDEIYSSQRRNPARMQMWIDKELPAQ